ncbi:hypothetical protein SAMN06265379_108152 [Saccharicrinis carchari]|uniref:Uncharacterized protein n=1 Tax=Saccharicrinis carchari TaxID=1168039 RepID=A0A521EDG1_SACCC|nr:DUF4398 domain-containing protein [Saccharicrinis carchari]SMO81966.1 hypothetical protein SAMN06265379_108152 [Saccharicrinis carchari]
MHSFFIKIIISVIAALVIFSSFTQATSQSIERNIRDSVKIVELSQEKQDLEQKLVKKDTDLELEKNKSSMNRIYYAGIVLLFIITLLIILLIIANKSKDKMLERADKDGDIMEVTDFLMRQSLGLPQGSLRGIIAIIVATTFISSVFYYGTLEEVPDAFKIIVSLVFGYYFSKSEDQTRNVINAMLGKTKQEVVKKQEAKFALSEAKNAKSDVYAAELYDQAKEKISSAENAQRTGEAIAFYNEAIELARKAKRMALDNKQIKANEETNKNRKRYDDYSREIQSRIGDLKAIKTNEYIIKGLEDSMVNADAQAQAGSFKDALITIERVKERIDTLLLEYDEAERFYSAFDEEKKNDIEDKLEDALSTFNNSFVNDIPGDNERLIESIVRMQAKVKDRNEKLLPALRKRFLGIEIENSDINDIVKDLNNRGDKPFFKALFETSAIKIGAKLNDSIREKIKAPEVIESLLLGTEEEKGLLFKSIFEKNGIEDQSTFNKFIDNAKKGLIDSVLGDQIKQALPEDVDFEDLKSLFKGAQQDKDGKSVSSKIQKILDVGETILGHTPIGGAAKIAGTIIRGIFKLFGRKKR